jgi:prepilin-type processing-associated H-X9-DG protein
VEPRRILDGASNTYLAGEKYLDTRHYETGLTFADRGFALIGYATDTVRMTSEPPARDRAQTSVARFGSAHSDACNLAYCDGSVRAVAYEVDAEVHRAGGNRADGLAN